MRGEIDRAALLREASTTLKAVMRPDALRRAEPDIAAILQRQSMVPWSPPFRHPLTNTRFRTDVCSLTSSSSRKRGVSGPGRRFPTVPSMPSGWTGRLHFNRT